MKFWQMLLLQSLILMAPHLSEEKAKTIAITLIVVAVVFMFFEEYK